MLGMGSTQPGWVKIKYKSELVELNQTQVKTHTLFWIRFGQVMWSKSNIVKSRNTCRIKRESAKHIKKMKKKKKKNQQQQQQE